MLKYPKKNLNILNCKHFLGQSAGNHKINNYQKWYLQRLHVRQILYEYILIFEDIVRPFLKI